MTSKQAALKVYATVVYEMKVGKEERFPVYNSEGLKHERASAEREVHDPKSHVTGYRVE
jgi:hypothetical protein